MLVCQRIYHEALREPADMVTCTYSMPQKLLGGMQVAELEKKHL